MLSKSYYKLKFVWSNMDVAQTMKVAKRGIVFKELAEGTRALEEVGLMPDYIT